MSETKRVYAFGKKADGSNDTEGNKNMKFQLGGKGANLAEMALMGLPVPPGFTITCQACMEYYNADPPALPAGLAEEIAANIDRLEAKMGKRLGDPADPLLVSVRSGSPFSMPGMMDTVLNLGLNDESVQGVIAQTGNDRFAWDSYRRFIQMFSKVVLDVDGDLFENAITRKRNERGVEFDTDLSSEDLRDMVADFREIVADHVSADKYPGLAGADGRVAFPQDVATQLSLAIEAVFGSWMNDRAVYYRKMEKLADDLGTAVNVQAMVFGNKGETSATGVGFTRNPADGSKEHYGDFLTNAQGEDVVAGIRHTRPISELGEVLPDAAAELWDVFDKLEAEYRDMCDIEFTVEQGKLWMLQTRIGKRTARAALKIAIDMVGEGMIDREEAILRIDPAQLDQLLHPQFDIGKKIDVAAKGLNASPGAAVGAAVFSSADAVEAKAAGRKVILVRWETNPDDLPGMDAAQGILTSHGGKTSHAAVVARGMGKPCVCGVDRLRIDADAKTASIAGSELVIHEGDTISIDGTTGSVVIGAVPLCEPEVTGDFDTILSWADEYRRLGVRANADTPDDAALGRRFGAAGIGLCRTEHMFLGDRKAIVQDIILAEDDDTSANALARLLEVQIDDYLGIFEAMDGLPVTVRLLDPPLHEFLDSPRELEVQIVREEMSGGDPAQIAAQRRLLARLDAMAEANPMLGLRGCRLGIMHPEIYGMQVRAIVTAAARLRKQGKDPRPEIMIPLVSVVAELATLRAESETIVADIQASEGITFDVPIGTMIELPRAAVTADEVATAADFFSFGTNDLTQTVFGFSRDDIEAKFLPKYLERKILPRNPFETIDAGVAEVVRIAVEKGRQTNPEDQARRMRRARRRPGVGADLQRPRLGLRVLLAVPRPAGPPGRRAGDLGREEERVGQPVGRARRHRKGFGDVTDRPDDTIRHTRGGGGRGAPPPLAARGLRRREPGPRASADARPAAHRLPARPRPHHPLQVVPPPHAQDAGVPLARGRSLPHAPHAHPGGRADRPLHRACPASQRGPCRGRLAGSRPRPHAVRPHRRGGAVGVPARDQAALPEARRAVPPQPPEPADRGAPRVRGQGPQPHLGGPRRHPLSHRRREVRHPGRPDRRHRRSHRVHQPRHRRRHPRRRPHARRPAPRTDRRPGPAPRSAHHDDGRGHDRG